MDRQTLTEEQVREETHDYLAQILGAFRRHFPELPLNGLACECDPGAGAMYVYLCDTRGDAQAPAATWPHSYVEQDIVGTSRPEWLDAYERLVAAYYSGAIDDYQTVADAFATVLAGVSRALADLEASGQLQVRGFVEQPVLDVWTEDDERVQTGRERVAAYRRPPT